MALRVALYAAGVPAAERRKLRLRLAVLSHVATIEKMCDKRWRNIDLLNTQFVDRQREVGAPPAPRFLHLLIGDVTRVQMYDLLR